MRFPSSQLSRDHIRPLSQGGRDTWMNVVTACRRCNNLKASKTPEQAGLQLIAVPFTPTYAEYIYLKGRRVLADQMEYLLAHFPRTSPLHATAEAAAAQRSQQRPMPCRRLAVAVQHLIWKLACLSATLPVSIRQPRACSI